MVFVKADARARYERVVDVVDNLRAAGVDQLGLLTDQKEPGKMANGAADAAATAGPGQVDCRKRIFKGAIIWEWQLAGQVARKQIST